MARWLLSIDDQVMFEGDTADKAVVEEIANFMREVHDNNLPGPFPSSETFDKGNWKHLVRGSIMLVTEFFGTPEIRALDFDIDDLVVILPPAPQDAVF